MKHIALNIVGFLRRRALLIVALTFVHYVASEAIMVAAFRNSYDHFDHERPYTLSEKLMDGLAETLMWPGFPISMRIGLGWLPALHWLIQVMNSVLWGVALSLLLSGLFRSVQKTRQWVRRR